MTTVTPVAHSLLDWDLFSLLSFSHFGNSSRPLRLPHPARGQVGHLQRQQGGALGEPAEGT